MSSPFAETRHPTPDSALGTGSQLLSVGPAGDMDANLDCVVPRTVVKLPAIYSAPPLSAHMPLLMTAVDDPPARNAGTQLSQYPVVVSMRHNPVVVAVDTAEVLMVAFPPTQYNLVPTITICWNGGE